MTIYVNYLVLSWTVYTLFNMQKVRRPIKNRIVYFVDIPAPTVFLDDNKHQAIGL